MHDENSSPWTVLAPFNRMYFYWRPYEILALLLFEITAMSYRVCVRYSGHGFFMGCSALSILHTFVCLLGGKPVKKLLYVLMHILFATVFSSFLCIALLDWMGGCGESFKRADGTTQMGECIGRETFFNFLGVLL